MEPHIAGVQVMTMFDSGRDEFAGAALFPLVAWVSAGSDKALELRNFRRRRYR